MNKKERETADRAVTSVTKLKIISNTKEMHRDIQTPIKSDRQTEKHNCTEPCWIRANPAGVGFSTSCIGASGSTV